MVSSIWILPWIVRRRISSLFFFSIFIVRIEYFARPFVAYDKKHLESLSCPEIVSDKNIDGSKAALFSLTSMITRRKSVLLVASALLLPLLVLRLSLCDTDICPLHSHAQTAQMPCHKHKSNSGESQEECCKNLISTKMEIAKQSIVVVPAVVFEEKADLFPRNHSNPVPVKEVAASAVSRTVLFRVFLI